MTQLFAKLTKAEGPLDERLVRRYMMQLVRALAHCHRRGVCHRDLKLENILLTADDQIKLIDFGMAHQYKRCTVTGAIQQEHLSGACGSRSYAAPEVLSGRSYSGFAADMWSCGVCCFSLLFSFFPVTEATPADWRFRQLVRAQLDQASSVHAIFSWYGRAGGVTVSATAVDFLDRLLKVDPRQRSSSAEAVAQPWLNDRATLVELWRRPINDGMARNRYAFATKQKPAATI